MQTGPAPPALKTMPHGSCAGSACLLECTALSEMGECDTAVGGREAWGRGGFSQAWVVGLWPSHWLSYSLLHRD